MKPVYFSMIGAILALVGLILQISHLGYGKVFLLLGFTFLLIPRVQPLFSKKKA